MPMKCFSVDVGKGIVYNPVFRVSSVWFGSCIRSFFKLHSTDLSNILENIQHCWWVITDAYITPYLTVISSTLYMYKTIWTQVEVTLGIYSAKFFISLRMYFIIYGVITLLQCYSYHLLIAYRLEGNFLLLSASWSKSRFGSYCTEFDYGDSHW